MSYIEQNILLYIECINTKCWKRWFFEVLNNNKFKISRYDFFNTEQMNLDMHSVLNFVNDKENVYVYILF